MQREPWSSRAQQTVTQAQDRSKFDVSGNSVRRRSDNAPQMPTSPSTPTYASWTHRRA